MITSFPHFLQTSLFVTWSKVSCFFDSQKSNPHIQQPHFIIVFKPLDIQRDELLHLGQTILLMLIIYIYTNILMLSPLMNECRVRRYLDALHLADDNYEEPYEKIHNIKGIFDTILSPTASPVHPPGEQTSCVIHRVHSDTQ